MCAGKALWRVCEVPSGSMCCPAVQAAPACRGLCREAAAAGLRLLLCAGTGYAEVLCVREGRRSFNCRSHYLRHSMILRVVLDCSSRHSNLGWMRPPSRARSLVRRTVLRASFKPAPVSDLIRVLLQFTNMWNITGTRIHTAVRSSQPWAQGSLIPGSNYSAHDDHGGLKVAGL